MKFFRRPGLQYRMHRQGAFATSLPCKGTQSIVITATMGTFFESGYENTHSDTISKCTKLVARVRLQVTSCYSDVAAPQVTTVPLLPTAGLFGQYFQLQLHCRLAEQHLWYHVLDEQLDSWDWPLLPSGSPYIANSKPLCSWWGSGLAVST